MEVIGEAIHEFVGELTERLRCYGYRPLTLSECLQLYRNAKTEIGNLNDILSYTASNRYLKVYEYGEIYIGLEAWDWFAPEGNLFTIRVQANLVEWYLRITNQPARAEIIADGIWSDIGDFRLTAFDVANACEKNPRRFSVDDDGDYGLRIWESAIEYKQSLERLLRFETMDIAQIVDRLSKALAGSLDTGEAIVTALNLYEDSFVEVAPFKWALKNSGNIDYSDLTFDDLVPK